MQTKRLTWLVSAVLIFCVAAAGYTVVAKPLLQASDWHGTVSGLYRQDSDHLVLDLTLATFTSTPTGTGTPTATSTAVPTNTPTPTATSTPTYTRVPTGTPTTSPTSDQPCGPYAVASNDMPAVTSMGANVVMTVLYQGQSVEQWRAFVSNYEANDIKLLLTLWPLPWTWNSGTGTWDFGSKAIPYIQFAAELQGRGHLLALRDAEEPLGHGTNAAQLRQLYSQIKAVADIPIYFPEGSFWYWRNDPTRLVTDGMCDVCSPHANYPFTGTDVVYNVSTYDHDNFVMETDREIAFMAEHAPNSQYVALLQTFALPAGNLRMPTQTELHDAVDIMRARDVPILFYPHQQISSNYTDWLANHPELWPNLCTRTSAGAGTR